MLGRTWFIPLAVVALLASALVPAPLAAQSAPGSQAVEAPEADELPDPGSTLLLNSLLPGTAQIALGDVREGRRLLAGSLALNVVGNGLIIWQQIDRAAEVEGGLGIYRRGDQTYLLPPGDDAGLVSSDWRFNAGLLMSLWGSLLSSYSQWAAYREFSDRLEVDAPRTGHESLGELLLAPYQAEHLLNYDVFPFFPMTIIGQLDWTDLRGYGAFFTREEVDFWGMRVSPWAGLAMNTLFTFALVHANATAEELLYRGIQLETRGVVRSSLGFGAVHLPNMLVPGVSVEQTLYQTLFATLFGFYAADRTVANDYDIRRMVALHFWHNVVAFTAGFLEQPADPVISWRLQISW